VEDRQSWIVGLGFLVLVWLWLNHGQGLSATASFSVAGSSIVSPNGGTVAPQAGGAGGCG